MAAKPQIDFVIVASSARYLAEAASHAGYRVATADAFADTDTRAITVDCRRIPLTPAGLSPSATEATCFDLAGDTVPGLVAGAGADAHADILTRMCNRLHFYGNPPEVFAACADPHLFTRHLDALGIERPPPAITVPGVRKRAGASGGGEVRLVAPDDNDACGAYLPGIGISHLFVASRERFETIGINTQWSSAHAGNSGLCRSFHYGGAINTAPLNAAHRDVIDDTTDRLVSHFSLRGINSIDYVLCAGRLFCLELNPRPGATMQLYEDDAPGHLFESHIQACSGTLLPPQPNVKVRAHAIIYAPYRRVITENMQWPPGVRDKPAAGVVAAGTPLCSLCVSGDCAERVLSDLNEGIKCFYA